MGMSRRTGVMWSEANNGYLSANERASDAAGTIGGASKIFRMILQSAVLAVGAILVIKERNDGRDNHCEFNSQFTRAVPGRTGDCQLERDLWRPVRPVTRSSTADIVTGEKGADAAPGAALLDLGRKCIHHGARRTAAAGLRMPVLRWHQGQGLGIIGPSGSGKSTLARALVGVWPAARGRVRIDDATFEQWSSETLGDFIGYLPTGRRIVRWNGRDEYRALRQGCGRKGSLRPRKPPASTN